LSPRGGFEATSKGLFANCGASVKIAKLSYGDYIINDKITIERKTADDFLLSIIDRRLFNQLSNLKKKLQPSNPAYRRKPL